MIFLTYLTILLLPGTVAIWLAVVSRHRFLWAFAISLGLFVFSQIPVRVGGGTLQHWLTVYCALVVITWVVCVLVGRRFGAKYRPTARVSRSSAARDLPITASIIWLICLLAWGGTFWIIGPYTEVPADIWNHLVRIGWELGRIEQGHLSSYANQFPAVTLLNREYIHSLHAGIWSISGATTSAFLWESQLAITCIFISALFWFFHSQMLDRWSVRRRAVVAGIATALTTVWMGTGDWAFIRYYAIAPIIFTVPLVFLGVQIFVDYLRGEISKLVVAILSLGLILILQGLVHIQEAGILSVLLFLIALFAWIQIRFDQENLWPTDSHRRIQLIGQALIMCAVVATPFLLIMIEPKVQHPGVILKPSTSLPFLRDLWIIDPTRQVWSTLTIGGVLSPLLIAMHWRVIRLSPYVVAAAVLPLVTVFNPIFIHLWERLLPATLLWRFTLFFPAGLLVAFAIGSLAEQRNRRGQLFRLAPIIAAFILLLPIPYSSPPLIVSRAFSFAPLHERQTEAWLTDLAQFLKAQPRQVIFTDPVTAYVLRGLTNQIIPGTKFYEHSSGFDFRKPYSEQPEVLFQDGLVVLNFRNGAESKTTKALNHWDKHELMVTRFYPPELQQTLEDRRFTLIWSNRDVFVYSPPAS